MATDIRDEAALRAMAALIMVSPQLSQETIAATAFAYAEAFLRERKYQADKRESELRASLNHD